MTDPGLNHRLRQRSRRAGIMIGLSMLLTIAVCVASFSMIYAGLDDVVGDFVSRAESDANPTPFPTEVAQAAPTEAAGGEPTAPPPTPTPEPEDSTEAEAEPTPTPESDEFQPDYQIDSTGSVNFRSGPGTQFETLYALPLEEPLQYLGVSEPSSNPDADGLSPGQVWMQFRTENGDEGWIREIDVTEYVP